MEDVNGRVFSVPRHWLPPNAREGDVLREELAVIDRSDQRRVTLTIDPEERKRRMREVDALKKSLPQGPKGDFTL